MPGSIARLATIAIASWMIAALCALASPTDGSIGGDRAAPAVTVEPAVRTAAAAPETVLDRRQRARIQKALNERGFDVGRPDGAFGKKTSSGIRNYQSSVGAAPTGALTAEQIADLLGQGGDRQIQAETASAAPGIGKIPWFEILDDTDLDGGDIRLPWDDPALQKVSANECRALCEAESGCVAFTFNQKAGVCFLKGAGFRKKPFANAISGVARDVPVRPPPPPPRPAGSFQNFEGVEFVGADLPAPGGADADACFSICINNPVCVAFTVKEGKCLPKAAGYTAERSPGATSSIREGHSPITELPILALPNGVEDLDVTRHAGGSEAEQVARVREAAALFGQSCAIERPAIEQIQRGARATIGQTTLEVGEEVIVDWSRESAEAELPVYLLMSTDQPVRFSGDNFYALTPGARAAFGLETFGSRTRAVVPLNGIAMPASGEIRIRPLLAGTLRIEWSVVGYLRQCQEEVVATPEHVDVRVVAPNQAEIALQETSSLVDPISVMESPDRSRRVEIYDGRYRLLSADGTEIVERVGTNVLFSPTGRFLTADANDAKNTNGNGVIEVSELYAGVKRQVVQQTDGRQTPWLARNQMVGDFAFF